MAASSTVGHNYDGDMLTDEVAQVHRSPGFITSNLIGKREDTASGGTMVARQWIIRLHSRSMFEVLIPNKLLAWCRMARSSRSLRWARFGPLGLWPTKTSSNASATLTFTHETADKEWQRWVLQFYLWCQASHGTVADLWHAHLRSSLSS